MMINGNPQLKGNPEKIFFWGSVKAHIRIGLGNVSIVLD
jgi:hypothetical protein